MELSEQDIARGVCVHGFLKRSCEICELKEELELLHTERRGLATFTKTETVVLTCKGEDGGVFESAIMQLGYTINDSCWDDETNIMTYEVKKKR